MGLPFSNHAFQFRTDCKYIWRAQRQGLVVLCKDFLEDHVTHLPRG